MGEEIKYLKDGEEVILFDTLENGYLVRNIFETEDNIIYSDAVYFVNEVFDSAPIKRYNDTINQLKTEIDKLHDEKHNLKIELSNIKNKEKELFEKFSKFEQLKRLNDFIEGKITHYVILSYNPEIIEAGKAKCDDHYRDEFKLLTLFGNTKGNLQWRLNSYRDGSGFSQDVVPCFSYNQALEEMQKYIDSKKDEVPSGYIIKAAEKYNLSISDEYKQKYKENEINNKREKIRISEEKIKDLKFELDCLMVDDTIDTRRNK